MSPAPAIHSTGTFSLPPCLDGAGRTDRRARLVPSTTGSIRRQRRDNIQRDRPNSCKPDSHSRTGSQPRLRRDQAPECQGLLPDQDPSHHPSGESPDGRPSRDETRRHARRHHDGPSLGGRASRLHLGGRAIAPKPVMLRGSRRGQPLRFYSSFSVLSCCRPKNADDDDHEHKPHEKL
jgi:hypothetical protein